MKDEPIEISRDGAHIVLVFADKSVRPLSLEMARNLRSALEAVISRRRKKQVATLKRTGMQRDPEEVSPTMGLGRTQSRYLRS